MIKKIKTRSFFDKRTNHTHTVALVGLGFVFFVEKIINILFFCLIPLFFYINKLFINSLIFEVFLLVFAFYWLFSLARAEKKELSTEEFIKYFNELIKK